MPILHFVIAQSAADFQFLDYLSRASVIVFLVLFILGLRREWWVLGNQHKDLLTRHERLRAEKDAWMHTALKSTGIADTLSQELRRGGN
jgi:hypothetical protein